MSSNESFSTESAFVEIDWSTEPTLEVSTLLDGSVYQVPIKAAMQWRVCHNYFDGQVPRTGDVFTFPASVSNPDLIRLIVEFSKGNAEIKVSHLPGPTYQAVDLLKSPYNVPKWAYDWIMERTMQETFELVVAAYDLQFTALYELCAIMLAQIHVNETLDERNITAGFPEGLSDEQRKEIWEKHKDWANVGDDVSTSFE